MKLFRLKSQKNNLSFIGNLNTNIVLKPNSKIGLKNLSFKKQEIPITINNVVDATFQFTIQNHNYLCVLNYPATYTKSGIDELREELEDIMNSKLTDDNGFVIGGAWRVSVDYDAFKFLFTFSQNPVINIVQEQINGYVKVGIDDGNPDAITKTSVMNNDADSAIGVQLDGAVNYECFSSLNRPDPSNPVNFIAGNKGGCGFLRCQIVTISADVASNGFFIGMSDKKLNSFNTAGGLFGVERFNYALRAKNTGVPYQFMTNKNTGSASNAAIHPRVGDVLEISLDGGTMRISVYSALAPVETIIFDELNELENRTLYPYLVFYTGTDNSVSNYSFTPLNPLTSTAGLSLPEHNILQYGATNVPIQELYDRNYELSLNPVLSKYLGFRELYQKAFAKTVIFYSDDSVIFVDDTECYIVLIENFSIDSYDMTLKKQDRRSILDVIQNIRNKTDEDVYYASDNPLMISLNNAGPIMLKNLNLQILDADDNRPISQDISNMAIVIE